MITLDTVRNVDPLSFKTNKNEALVKVVPFQGNLVVFANSDNVGGSIHLVTGAGDDYEDQYYSPYRRKTINQGNLCDNPDTVQIAENLLIFKYFDTIYYIEASELNRDTINLYSCNDKIKMHSPEVQIPWDDNSCISEVTEGLLCIESGKKNTFLKRMGILS